MSELHPETPTFRLGQRVRHVDAGRLVGIFFRFSLHLDHCRLRRAAAADRRRLGRDGQRAAEERLRHDAICDATRRTGDDVRRIVDFVPVIGSNRRVSASNRCKSRTP